MKIGLIIGKFAPLHNGSLTLCKVAATLSDKLIIFIVGYSGESIPIQVRTNWLRQENPDAIIQSVSDQTILSLNLQLQESLLKLPTEQNQIDFHLFSSDPSQSELAKKLNIKFTILDPNRLAQNIRAKEIFNDPYSNWFNMPGSVRSSLVRRIVLIGPESVGKSTLAKKLKKTLIQNPFLPEYGRPYEVFRDPGPYKNSEFEDICAVHAAHRKALLPFSGPIFIEDTDELATAVWVEMLMGKRLLNIEQKINLPFLYLLMSPSVPFVPEKTRYFNNEARSEFFNKIKTKLDLYQAPYKVLNGSWSTRTKICQQIIKDLLAEKVNWSEIIH